MKSYLMVESFPSHPTRVEEFNTWYDQVHVPEVCEVEGVTGATRLAPASADGGGFVVLYHLEGDPEAEFNLGVAYAAQQSAELLAGGAPGIHFYALNRAPATRAVLGALRAAQP